MKIVVAVLIVALAVLGAMYYQQGQDLRKQLDAAREQARTAEAEVATVKTQTAGRVAELEQSVTAIDAEKASSTTRVGELQQRLAAVERDLQDEKSKMTDLETQKAQVQTQLSTVSNQLQSVRQQLTSLEQTHQATEAELGALREREAALVLERASLERQLNDLDALKSQIRLVKRHLREQKIAEWKRQDELAAANGNNGLLLKNGQWLTTGKPSS